MKIGVVVDSHGKSLAPAKEFFENEDINAILVNGDFQSYNGNLESILELGGDTPTYVIPGSHENKYGYNAIMQKAEREYNNIINAQEKKAIQLSNEILLVLYGGATWAPKGTNGYTINPLLDVSEIFSRIETQKPKPKTIVLQMHEPPKDYGDIAQFIIMDDGSVAPLATFKNHPQYEQIKMYTQKSHVGNENLSFLIEDLLSDYNVVATFGHIHENYQLGPSAQEIPTKREVKEGEKVAKLAVNAGPYMDGFITLIDIENDKTTYRRIKIEVKP